MGDVLAVERAQPDEEIAKSRPSEHQLPFATWSLSKLAEFLVAEGVVDDISHEGLRTLLREEGVTFQRLKTWKASTDPEYETEKARVEHLYAIVDVQVSAEVGKPTVVFCMDEFGPLNLQPAPTAVGRGLGEAGGCQAGTATAAAGHLPARPGSTHLSSPARQLASSPARQLASSPARQLAALRYFALDGTDHRAQASMIRRHIIWRNNHTQDH
ncbi:hypothetical protein MXD63_32455 [Frankia sp. Cpl3]|nr:hypothetical protein [Frankia sp. Cpl3]